MKLHFIKTDKGDIQVQMEKGTAILEFDYIEMLKELTKDNQIEPDWGNLDEDEKTKLEELLNKITNAVKTGLEKQLE